MCMRRTKNTVDSIKLQELKSFIKSIIPLGKKAGVARLCTLQNCDSKTALLTFDMLSRNTS